MNSLKNIIRFFKYYLYNIFKKYSILISSLRSQVLYQSMHLDIVS